MLSKTLKWFLLGRGALAYASACMSFARDFSTSIEHVTVLNSTFYPAGKLNNSGVVNQHAFCEVYTSFAYNGSNDAHLIAALWLPDPEHYRNRFMAVGNGGMAGAIDYGNMMTQLNSGYGFAVAGGNAGHLASENNNGVGEPHTYIPYLHDPAQVQAWIHNAISIFTPTARSLVTAYYGRPPTYSYYDGCSTGGAQGFALAQYHPDLFDGIIAGCPGNWYSHLALSFLWNAQHTNTNATFLSQAALNFTTNAVLKACDGLDGVHDGVIENPERCHFDVETLACQMKGLEASTGGNVTCLTQAQLLALKSIYAGPRSIIGGSSASDDSEKVVQIYPGFSFGSEISLIQQEGILANAFSIPILQNLVYDNLTYNASTFDYNTDVSTVDARAGTQIDSIATDLSAFASVRPRARYDYDSGEIHRRTNSVLHRGGKLLVYQGWADPYNAATWPIIHRDQVAKSTRPTTSSNGSKPQPGCPETSLPSPPPITDAQGQAQIPEIDDWFRLFMIPGGGHCGQAEFYPQVPGTYLFVGPLIDWVECGRAPNEVAAIDTTVPGMEGIHGTPKTKKLCPWPRTARYNGGDVDDWNSFSCE